MITSHTMKFSNDSDAYDWVDANGIARSKIYYRGNDPCVDVVPSSIHKKNSPSKNRVSKSVKDYSGNAYVTAYLSDGRYWYDTTNKSKSYELQKARVHLTIESAKLVLRFSSSKNKVIVEVMVRDGVPIRVKKEVK